MRQFTTITSVQTKGLKKYFHEQKYGIKEIKRSANTVDENDKVTNSVRGVKRTIEDAETSEDEEVVKKSRDYNVVGVEISDSSDNDEEIVQTKNESKLIEIAANKNEKSEEEQEVVVKVADEKEKIVEEKKSEQQQVIERKPATYVHVERDAEIQIARLKLPIIAEEQMIMETISENSVIILAGGKADNCFYH